MSKTSIIPDKVYKKMIENDKNEIPLLPNFNAKDAKNVIIPVYRGKK